MLFSVMGMFQKPPVLTLGNYGPRPFVLALQHEMFSNIIEMVFDG
jgi:hypothetical protein